MVNSFGTGKAPDERLSEIVRENFSLTPAGMIKSLNLRRPIYQKTAAFGHFGQESESFSWEATDKVEALRASAQLTVAAAV
jgi:S-adenosylmethionine synthetase